MALVRDFINAATGAAAKLRNEFGTQDLLGGWHQKRIPERGVLSDGTEFFFHGIGLCVERSGVCVDFDFGPDGETDGFDAWRLWLFAQARVREHPQLQELDRIELVLGALVAARAVRGHDTLFYLPK